MLSPYGHNRAKFFRCKLAWGHVRGDSCPFELATGHPRHSHSLSLGSAWGLNCRLQDQGSRLRDTIGTKKVSSRRVHVVQIWDGLVAEIAEGEV